MRMSSTTATEVTAPVTGVCESYPTLVPPAATPAAFLRTSRERIPVAFAANAARAVTV